MDPGAVWGDGTVGVVKACRNEEKDKQMKRQPWDPPTKSQWKQLAEIKRATGMRMPEMITFRIAAQIIEGSPVFAAERRKRRAAGRRKGYAKRDVRRKRRPR
jgi:hypothetical protein